ncbi:AMP-binding protein [Nocardioides sp. AE5]|uniref:AMP-binding protein n=1 Tax=Nocardioides sp. AE5 TaxID=2962573 RepID=UPI0028816B79|nr:AMP-binding protein [Nocardioides sp. AE5]MDT0201667.1 AMP-binding protein [Nocardioides sp. AE5]
MYPPTIANTTPDAIAYEMAGSGASLTFADLDARSNALAHLLRRNGVRPGDSLVILLPNDLAWPVAVAAGMRTGLEVTPINWHLRSTELVPMLAEAAPAALVTSPDLAPLAMQACAHLDRTPYVLTVGGEITGTTEFDSALDGLPTTPVEDELLGARVLFSGGSTGRPKAYRQPLLGIHPLDAPARHPGLGAKLGIEAGIRFLSPAPSYHAAPFTFQLMVASAGGTVVCMESFDATGALRTLHERSITHSQWVPTMLSRLLAVEDRHDIPVSPTHRVAVTSGAPCPPDLKDAINDWWGDVLHEYYGASEGYGHTYISPAESRERRGSVGRPLGAAKVRVTDAAGHDVPTGTVGRVGFEGTAADGSTTVKGMGDLGRLDEDGYLYLSGRESFMIISGGVNIHPEEIEAVLTAHPAVADAAVFGLPHPDFGEEVVAVVELEPDADLDAATRDDLLRDHCRDHLARFKAPRRYEYVDKLPRLPTGKLNKKSLQSRYLPRTLKD